MAADVSSLVRLLNGYNDDRTVAKESSNAKSTSAPMTRDLLGSRGGGDRSLELDLDLQVPTGYEKRLDLKVRFDSSSLFSFLHRLISNRTNREREFDFWIFETVREGLSATMQLDELVVDNKRRAIESNSTDDDGVVSGFEFPSESNQFSGGQASA